MPNGICFKFDVSYDALMVLLVLEATLVLPIPQVPLFEVEIARCKNCSSKLCLIFGPLESNLYTKGGCARTTTLEQLPATMVCKWS